MKKTIKKIKLTLNAETIKQLDEVQLGYVAGGMTGSICPGCSGTVCSGPSNTGQCNNTVCLCSFNTCAANTNCCGNG